MTEVTGAGVGDGILTNDLTVTGAGLVLTGTSATSDGVILTNLLDVDSECLIVGTCTGTDNCRGVSATGSITSISDVTIEGTSPNGSNLNIGVKAEGSIQTIATVTLQGVGTLPFLQ